MQLIEGRPREYCRRRQPVLYYREILRHCAAQAARARYMLRHEGEATLWADRALYALAVLQVVISAEAQGFVSGYCRNMRLKDE